MLVFVQHLSLTKKDLFWITYTMHKSHSKATKHCSTPTFYPHLLWRFLYKKRRKQFLSIGKLLVSDWKKKISWKSEPPNVWLIISSSVLSSAKIKLICMYIVVMGRVRVLYHGVTCIFSAYTRRVYTSVCAEKISLTSGPFQGTSRKTWSVAYRFLQWIYTMP